MVGLLDIAPATESVSVSGVPIAVFGVSVKALVDIVTAYPNVRAAFSNDAYEVGNLVREAPEAIADVIASAVGHPGDKQYVEAAAKLSVEDQLTILDAAMRLTLPSGMPSFLERLQRLSSGIATAEERVPDKTSQKPSKD